MVGDDYTGRSLTAPVEQALQEGGFAAGAIPSPDALARYNAIVPGAAERILRMAEEQSRQHYQLEQALIQSEGRRAVVAMGLSTAVAVLCVLLGSANALLSDWPVPGTVIAFLGVALFVGVFLSVNRGRAAQPRPRLSQGRRRQELPAFDL